MLVDAVGVLKRETPSRARLLGPHHRRTIACSARQGPLTGFGCQLLSPSQCTSILVRSGLPPPHGLSTGLTPDHCLPPPLPHPLWKLGWQILLLDGDGTQPMIGPLSGPWTVNELHKDGKPSAGSNDDGKSRLDRSSHISMSCSWDEAVTQDPESLGELFRNPFVIDTILNLLSGLYWKSISFPLLFCPEFKLLGLVHKKSFQGQSSLSQR